MSSKIKINTPFIKLDAFLKFAGESPTGAQAKLAILSGAVFVNGEACRMRNKKLYPGDTVTVNETTWEVEG
jgi:ribosome-associated protein